MARTCVKSDRERCGENHRQKVLCELDLFEHSMMRSKGLVRIARVLYHDHVK